MTDDPLDLSLDAISGMPLMYVLVNGTPEPERDVIKWVEWMSGNWPARIVDKTRVRRRHRGRTRTFKVSTVFLGLDHNYFPGGQPLLWETAVFSKDGCDIIGRYASLGQAKQGHWETVAQLKQGETKTP